MRPTVLFYVWRPRLAHSRLEPGILAARDGCRGNAQGGIFKEGPGRDRDRAKNRDVDCAAPSSYIASSKWDRGRAS